MFVSAPAPLLPFHWRVFHIALIATAIAVTSAWIVNPPVYFTNDDVLIRLALEGRTAPGQPPTGFTLLTHAILGWTVVYLERLLPVVPWWDLILAATLVWSLAVIAALAWDALGRDWLARAMAVCAVLVAAVPLVAGLQFTISAVLAGGAAVLLALVEVSSGQRPRRSVLIMAAAMLAAGLLVRTLGAMAGVVAVTLFCIPLLVAGEGRIRRAAVVCGAALALCAAVQYVDGWLYMMRDEWGAYYRYHWMVVRLLEWGGELPASDLQDIRASVGWSSNDWEMLQRFFGVDPTLHGLDRVARAYDARAAMLGGDEWLRWVSVRLASIDAARLRVLLVQSMAPLLAIAAVAAGYATRRAVWATAVLFVLFCVLCLAVEAGFKELPFRLLAPLQVCLVAVGLITVSALRRRPSPLAAILALALVTSVLAAQLTETASGAAASRRDSLEVDREVEELLRLSPSLLVLHSDTFPRERWWRPFHQPSIDLAAIALGANNQNPLMRTFLLETRRQDLFRAACSDPSVLVIAEEGRLDFVTTYLREHFDTPVTWTAVYRGSFPAWRCAVTGPGA